MPNIKCEIFAQGDTKEAYEIATQMEDYPKFMENLDSVKVIERGPNYTITDWNAIVDGKDFKWQEKDIFDPDHLRITYKQTKGDLKKFEGEWRFTPENGGVRITLTVEFEMGIPMLAPLLNPILIKKVKANSDGMLTAMKKKLETK